MQTTVGIQGDRSKCQIVLLPVEPALSAFSNTANEKGNVLSIKSLVSVQLLVFSTTQDFFPVGIFQNICTYMYNIPPW